MGSNPASPTFRGLTSVRPLSFSGVTLVDQLGLRIVPMNGLTVSIPSPSDAAIFDGLPVTTVVWDFSRPSPLPALDAVFAPGYTKPEAFAQLGSVAPTFVQIASIGYDGIPDVAPPGFTFANATSVHETATAEATVAAILAVSRDIPKYVRQQDAHTWNRTESIGLADSRVAIVGAGGVGNAVMDRLLPFEVKVERFARTARTDSRGQVREMSELASVLPDADIVAVAIPYVASTRHFIDDAFLSGMHDGAMIVNVARGPVADTNALIAHAERLRVVVDVTDPEPLPADNPLWDKAALVLPHIGGASFAYQPRRARLMRAQAERLLAGEEPMNIVFRS